MSTARIATPLVVGTMILVAALAGAMMALEPEKAFTWLVAMFFLPFAIVGVRVFRRVIDRNRETSKSSGGLRASLVAAGALLIATLGMSIIETLGLVGEDSPLAYEPIMIILIGAILVFPEIIGARLQRNARQEPAAHANNED